MRIFFDLDGTLLDSRQRLYLLFQHMVPASKISFEEYWSLKRNKKGHSLILREYFDYSGDEIKKFENDWLEKIENPEWLSLDKPFPGITDHLLQLKDRHTLYIVTARQFEDRALAQVGQYSWNEIFEKMFVTGGKVEKYDLLINEVTPDENDWFVGDTGKDVETGKLLGLKTAAVLSGFLSREKLMEYRPDLIVDSVLGLTF